MDLSSLWLCQNSPSEIRSSGNFRSFWPWLLVIFVFCFWGWVDNDIDLHLLQRCFVDEPLVCFFSNVFKYLAFFFERRRWSTVLKPSVDPFNHKFGWRIEPEKIRMYRDPETNSKNAWKWMVGRRSSPLGMAAFQGAFAVSFREYIRFIYWRKDYTPYGTVLFLITHEKPVHLTSPWASTTIKIMVDPNFDD